MRDLRARVERVRDEIADAAARSGRDPSAVTVIADTGQRYLSGELFGEAIEVDHPERDHTPDADILELVAAHRDRLEFIA